MHLPEQRTDLLTNYSLYLSLQNNDVCVLDSVWPHWGSPVEEAVYHVHCPMVRMKVAEFERNHQYQEVEEPGDRDWDRPTLCVDIDVFVSGGDAWEGMNGHDSQLPRQGLYLVPYSGM